MSSAIDDVRRYKPFIDGLRAIAILTVVGSHVGLSGFAGGYIGVDIFFVISGYLIIGQIDADVAAGRFSFVDFAARRALRILPPFLLVMVACLILVSTLFIEFDYRDFAESFAASSVMLSNHYFLGQQSYFDRSAFTRVLLHMWSLSVEEQFYLVAPFAIVTLYAVTRGLGAARSVHARKIITAGLAVASLAACIVFSRGVSHNPAFYLMPMRGWEFIVGGEVAVVAALLQRRSRITVDVLAVIGLAAIVIAVVTFDATTRYPSYHAVVPVFGAAMIIACGIAAPGNPVARALATPPMVAIGLVSFGWYLWHWPLLTFLRTSTFPDDDLATSLAVAALALVLAVLTYLLLERPIRRWRRRVRPRSLPVVVSMLSACVVVGIGGYVWSMTVATRLLPEIAGFTPTIAPRTPFPPTASRGLLLGDSHAAAIAPMLAQYARGEGAALTPLVAYACAPLPGIETYNWGGERVDGCRERFSAVDFSGADFVVLAARWNYYLDLPWSDPFYPPPRIKSQQAGETIAPLALLRRGLAELITEARKAGVTRIVLIAPLPEFPMQAADCLVRALRLGSDNCAIPRAAADARRAGTLAMLRGVASEFPEVRVLDPIEAFCTPGRCVAHDGRTLFFHDTNHLIAGGIERLYGTHEVDFRWAFRGARGAGD